MYMLINFIHMFKVIYNSFKCRLKFVPYAFIHNFFACKRIKSKPSSAVVFPSRKSLLCGREIWHWMPISFWYSPTLNIMPCAVHVIVGKAWSLSIVCWLTDVKIKDKHNGTIKCYVFTNALHCKRLLQWYFHSTLIICLAFLVGSNPVADINDDVLSCSWSRLSPRLQHIKYSERWGTFAAHQNMHL